MQKSPLRFLVLLALAGLLIVLSLSASISDAPPRHGSRADSAVGLQDQTATPAEAELTQSGSTDSIMWIGLVIVLIVLLPIALRKDTWQ